MTDIELLQHFIVCGINEKHRIYNFKTLINKYNFDINIYKICHVDLQDFSNDDLLLHFTRYGSNEIRIYNINLLVQKYNLDSKYIKEYNELIINKNYDEIKLYINELISYKNF